MANVKQPQAVHGFYKSNGVDPVANTEGPSLTRQEFAEECDINVLMARFNAHVIGGPGGLPPAGDMMYADFGNMPRTLMEYMEYMDMAEAEFMRLPAVVRKEFNNSAHEFVEFASDPANLPQMRTWGLAAPAKAPDGPAELPGSSKAPAAPAPPAEKITAGGASTHGST